MTDSISSASVYRDDSVVDDCLPWGESSAAATAIDFHVEIGETTSIDPCTRILLGHLELEVHHDQSRWRMNLEQRMGRRPRGIARERDSALCWCSSKEARKNVLGMGNSV